MKYLLVFLVVTLLDYGWGAYIKAVSQKRPYQAAVWSAGIYLIGMANTLLAVEDHWMLIPGTLGTLLGTFLAVTHTQE